MPQSNIGGGGGGSSSSISSSSSSCRDLISDPQISLTSSSHLKIVGAKRVT